MSSEEEQNGRLESDSLGEVWIEPVDALWGTTTQRAIRLFPISGLKQRPEFIEALAEVKMAAALANMDCGALDEKIGNAIVESADEVIDGKYRDQFPVDALAQMGAGTSIHMNMNEVLANLAHIKLGGSIEDEKKMVSPNDHVNMGQSTNDVIPTSIRIAALKLIYGKLLPALDDLEACFINKASEFADVIKSARTHMMDAVGTTLGNEFSGYASLVREAKEQLQAQSESLKKLGIGGTAAGTGINTAPGYREKVVGHLSKITGFDVKSHPNLFAAMQSMLPFSAVSGALRNLAIELGKIASDIILLNSGPSIGLAEITVPEVAPGSSIMPGKINPSMAEALKMVANQVIGNDTAVAWNSRQGQLDLNILMPNINFNLLESLEILSNALVTFRVNCLDGIQAFRDNCRRNFEASGAAATILNPIIGYKKAGDITLMARRSSRSIRETLAEMEGEDVAVKYDGLIQQEAERIIEDSKTLIGSLKA